MTDLTTVATKFGREASTKVREFAAANPVAAKAKDGVFTAVGMGVMGVQKASAALKNIKVVDPSGAPFDVQKATEELVSVAKRQAAWIDERVTTAVKAVDVAVQPIEEKLPTAVRDARAKARLVVEKAHEAWRTRLVQTPEAPAAKVTTAKATTAKKAPAKKTAKKA